MFLGTVKSHGLSQDFSKEGSHLVIHRVLTRLSPEYCRLFAYKKAYKGGGGGGGSREPQDPSLATPLSPALNACQVTNSCGPLRGCWNFIRAPLSPVYGKKTYYYNNEIVKENFEF